MPLELRATLKQIQLSFIDLSSMNSKLMIIKPTHIAASGLPIALLTYPTNGPAIHPST